MATAATAPEDKRSMRMIWKTLRLRHLGLAFFWACSMLTFRSTFLLCDALGTPENETLVIVVSFAANAATLFAISSIIEADPKRYEKMPAWVFAAFIIVGIVLLNVSGRLGAHLTMPTLIAGSVVTGVGYGYFWGSWAQVYGQMHPSRTSFYIPAVFLLTTTIFLLVSFADEQLGIPILALMVPLPLIALACLARSRKEVTLAAPKHDKSPVYLAAMSSLWSLILAGLILSCLFGFVWEMTVFSVGSVNAAHQMPLFLNFIVAIALTALALLGRKRIDISMAYRIIVPVIVAAFVVMPFFWEGNSVLLNAVVSACFGAFDVILWYMVVATAYDFSASGFIIGGLVRALSIISRLLGIGIGYIVMMIPDRPPLVIVGISLGAVYLLGMLFLLYRRRQTRTLAKDAEGTAFEHMQKQAGSYSDRVIGAEEGNASAQAPRTESTESETNSPESVYELIAEDYGLTRREAEVLPYLAKGRSAKVIAGALYVSESTIRTHTRRILEKTALHSKQDLIDLIERYG